MYEIPYLSYVAYLTQDGDAHAPAVLFTGTDQIGITGITYSQEGEYLITSDGKFTAGKTFCLPRGDAFDDESDAATYVRLSPGNENQVAIDVWDALNGGNRKELNVTTFPLAIEIRVYPAD